MKVTPSDSPDPNVGTVTITFPADLPAPNLAVNGTLTCDNVPVEQLPGKLTGGRITLSNIDLVHEGGACNVSLTLDDQQRPDPYGVPSQQLSKGFNIGIQPDYSSTFSVAYTGQPNQVKVGTTTGGTPSAGGDWQITAVGPTKHKAECDAPDQLPAGFPEVITLPDCPWPYISQVQVTVAYTYLGQTFSVNAGVPSSGTPPTTTTTTTTTTPPTTPAPATAGGSLGWTACVLLVIWPGVPLSRRLRRKEKTPR